MPESSPRRSARPARVPDSTAENAGVLPPGGAGSTLDVRPSPLEVLARHPLLVLIAAAACAAVGYLASQTQASEYESTARLFLVDPNSTLALDIARTTYVDPRRNARTRAELVLSDPVLRRAADELGVSVENIRDRIDAVPSREADVVTLTATAESPEEAARLVSILQEGYRAETLSRERAPFRRAVASVRSLRLAVQQQLLELRGPIAAASSTARAEALEEERQLLRDQLETLRDREAALESNAALLGTGVQLFERPELPEAPISPIPLRSAVIGALLGVISAVGLLWWRDGKRPPVFHPQAAAAALGAPLLADVPAARPWRLVTRHGSGRDEAYRRLNYFAETIVRDGGRLLFVTAARTADLRIPIPLRIAGALAAGGREVAVVDADRHRRRLTRHLRASSAHGLSDLDGDDPAPLLLPRRIGGSPPLAFLPLGRSRSRLLGLQGTQLYHRALTRLATRFDVTVASGPALVSLAEANPGPVPDTSVLVICGPNTPLGALTDLHGRLELVGLPAAGVVFDRSGRLERTLRRLFRVARRNHDGERSSSRRRRGRTPPPPAEGQRLGRDSAEARPARREPGN
jgi:capsular polysaccharide biosynthesis protein